MGVVTRWRRWRTSRTESAGPIRWPAPTEPPNVAERQVPLISGFYDPALAPVTTPASTGWLYGTVQPDGTTESWFVPDVHAPDCPAAAAFVPLWTVAFPRVGEWSGYLAGSMIHHPPEPCTLDGCPGLVVASSRETRSKKHRPYCTADHKAQAATPPPARPKGPAYTPPTRFRPPAPCPTPRKLVFESYAAAEQHFAELLAEDPTLQIYRCVCHSWHAGHPRGSVVHRVTPTHRPPMLTKVGDSARLTITSAQRDDLRRSAQEATDVAEVLRNLFGPTDPDPKDPPMLAPAPTLPTVHHPLASAAVDIASLPVDEDTPTPTCDALAAAYGVVLPVPPCSHETFLEQLEHFGWLDRMAALSTLLADIDLIEPWDLHQVPMGSGGPNLRKTGWTADCRICSFATDPHARKATTLARARRHAAGAHGWDREAGRG